ncbi:hypothetical protein ARMSODRAFT_955990 [Armillaria solidipes]|uniref:Uncharacterized protein n=1 Tax=Armillaria solidipes TaxID=1076256 RepID=A0A2H3C5A9_9AGAR|nr:hypothetical protein ARMSODRAFT_955990 [Armillaria solidipes]
MNARSVEERSPVKGTLAVCINLPGIRILLFLLYFRPFESVGSCRSLQHSLIDLRSAG